MNGLLAARSSLICPNGSYCRSILIERRSFSVEILEVMATYMEIKGRATLSKATRYIGNMSMTRRFQYMRYRIF